MCVPEDIQALTLRKRKLVTKGGVIKSSEQFCMHFTADNTIAQRHPLLKLSQIA